MMAARLGKATAAPTGRRRPAGEGDWRRRLWLALRRAATIGCGEAGEGERRRLWSLGDGGWTWRTVPMTLFVALVSCP
ncbi:unnamed protein product [Cuscuta campestris]|uniref:Uncharacterized protein n=1 Tax=Cuscuta campestris TaxID=132261 RepID=A0A484LP68_9ASTE|nr:unnamed protein product [Cuscuta campestris]